MTKNLFARLEADGYEQVVFGHDRASGLKSIVSVHSTVLGPALGGCRFYPYADENAALEDVLRLSRSMTWKASVAGLKLGGGKAVILGNPTKEKNEKLLMAFGRLVDRLNGAYITAEDSGTTQADISVIKRNTKYATGTDPKDGGWGDPSPYTARGVFEGVKACAKFLWGSTDLKGKRIAVQGVGNVGWPLAVHLRDAGAKLFVSDTNPNVLPRAKSELKAEIVDADKIVGVECDILSPNAMGGVINHETMKKLRCAIVAGGANNQLENEEVSEAILAKGIVYAPDYVINGGGLIHVGTEWLKGTHKEVDEKVTNIHNTVFEILERAKKEKTTTSKVALRIAQERIERSR